MVHFVRLSLRTGTFRAVRFRLRPPVVECPRPCSPEIPARGTLVFEPGQVDKWFEVTLCEDELFESTVEFGLKLSNPDPGRPDSDAKTGDTADTRLDRSCRIEIIQSS